MTEADIYPLLAELAELRVYPYVAPSGTLAPWVVFILPSAVSEDVLCGQAERATTLQVDVWAKSTDEARAIRDQARTALKSLNPVGLSERNDYEPETALYRATLEVQVWS